VVDTISTGTSFANLTTGGLSTIASCRNCWRTLRRQKGITRSPNSIKGQDHDGKPSLASFVTLRSSPFALFYSLLRGRWSPAMTRPFGSRLPTSFGTFRMPRMVAGVKFEHGHRNDCGNRWHPHPDSGTYAWRQDSRRWVRGVTFAAVMAVLAQAYGGITVLWYCLWRFLRRMHFGAIFFCLAASLAFLRRRLALGREQTGRPIHSSRSSMPP